MKRALAKATTLEDLTRVRNEAEAVRCLVQKAKLGLKMHNEAAEFKLRAERRAGEMLAALSLYGGDRRSRHADTPCKLRDLGISHHQSSRWQKEAAVPEKAFEAFLRDALEQEKEVTAAELIRLGAAERARKGRSKPRIVIARPNGNGYVVGELLPTKSAAPKHCEAASDVGLLWELIDEVENHRALLAGILLPYCERQQPLELAARRHAATLLLNLESAFEQLKRAIRLVQPRKGRATGQHAEPHAGLGRMQDRSANCPHD
jgi:hypothetical protein